MPAPPGESGNITEAAHIHVNHNDSLFTRYCNQDSFVCLDYSEVIDMDPFPGRKKLIIICLLRVYKELPADPHESCHFKSYQVSLGVMTLNDDTRTLTHVGCLSKFPNGQCLKYVEANYVNVT